MKQPLRSYTAFDGLQYYLVNQAIGNERAGQPTGNARLIQASTMENDQGPTIITECAEHVRIPVMDIPAYEAAASFLAVLAYPEDKKARGRFERAAYVKIVEHLAKDPEWSQSNQALRPAPLLQDRKLVESEYKRGIRIIRQSRMIAARMAAPTDSFLMAAGMGMGSAGAGGEIAERHGYLAPMNDDWIDQVSMDLDRLLGTNTVRVKNNIFRDCWKPSKPVLHLCLALQVILNEGDEMSYLDLPIEELFENPGLIMIIINRARHIRNFASYAFGIPSSRQIDLDWR
jgi:hypothetical protein